MRLLSGVRHLFKSLYRKLSPGKPFTLSYSTIKVGERDYSFAKTKKGAALQKQSGFYCQTVDTFSIL